MLRIIGGEFRSRRLAGPEGTEVTRPMPARIKESIFNLLRGWFEGARVLDLFAGVGTIGLEAVSRGAERVLMVEQNRQTFRLLQENIEALDCADRAEAIQSDALSPSVLLRAPSPLDLVFADPPYPLVRREEGLRRVLRQLGACREYVKDESFLVLRLPDLPEGTDRSIEGFAGPEVHEYGQDQNVLLYAPTREAEGEKTEGAGSNGDG